jgi:DNA-binding NarL/FixJ family response regulator
MTVRKKTILVVDDSIIILDRLTVKLQKLECAGAIHSTRTYAGALQLLGSGHIDIAVFDIHLEDKSGIDLLRITQEQYPNVVVIMLTNQANEQVEMMCKKLGAAWFLDKSKDFISIPQIISSIV